MENPPCGIRAAQPQCTSKATPFAFPRPLSYAWDPLCICSPGRDFWRNPEAWWGTGPKCASGEPTLILAVPGCTHARALVPPQLHHSGPFSLPQPGLPASPAHLTAFSTPFTLAFSPLHLPPGSLPGFARRKHCPINQPWPTQVLPILSPPLHLSTASHIPASGLAMPQDPREATATAFGVV